MTRSWILMRSRSRINFPINPNQQVCLVHHAITPPLLLTLSPVAFILPLQRPYLKNAAPWLHTANQPMIHSLWIENTLLHHFNQTVLRERMFADMVSAAITHPRQATKTMLEKAGKKKMPHGTTIFPIIILFHSKSRRAHTIISSTQKCVFLPLFLKRQQHSNELISWADKKNKFEWK